MVPLIWLGWPQADIGCVLIVICQSICEYFDLLVEALDVHM